MEFKRNHRTLDAIKKQANALGCTVEHWSNEQITCIELNYPIYGRKIYSMFSGLFYNKLEGAIYKYASDHNIPAPNRKQKWSKEDDEVFNSKYNLLPLDDFCKLFPDRTKQAIKSHALVLGLAKSRDNKIICIETKIIFDSFKQLEAAMGYNVKVVCPAIKRNGIVDNKYHFMYLSDFNKFGWKPKEKKVKPIAKPVVCDTGEVIMYGINAAAKKYNTSPSAIYKCCDGKLTKTGGHIWRYLTDEEQKNISRN